ncbi:MAG: hypothetical protein AAF220_04265 [Pseudomonadota bacterium]
MSTTTHSPTLPVKTATYEVDVDGVLKPLEPQHPVRFSFDMFDLTFDAEARYPRPKEDGDGSGILTVTASLGTLPFSIEARSSRALVNAAIRQSQDLTSRPQIKISDTNTLIMHGECVTPAPASPKSLMTDAARLILEIKPILEIVLLSLRHSRLAPTDSDVRTGRSGHRGRFVSDYRKSLQSA